MYINGFIRANRNCVRAEAQGEVFGEIAGIRSLCGIPVWPLILLDKCTLPHLAGVLEKRGFFFPIFSFYFFFLSFFPPLLDVLSLEHLLSACLSPAWQQRACVLQCPEPCLTCPQETWPHVHWDWISRHIPISLFWCFYLSVIENHSLQPKQTLSRWHRVNF